MRQKKTLIVFFILIMGLLVNPGNKQKDKINIFNQDRIKRADFIRAEYERELMELANYSPRLDHLLKYYALHREVGLLETVSGQGKYGANFWLSAKQQPSISLIIVLKEEEPVLRTNLPTIYGPINHGAAYDYINHTLFLYESGLYQEDNFFAVISFAHELFHAYTHHAGLVNFDSPQQIAQAEIATHIFISAVIDDITDGWYLKTIRQNAKNLLTQDPEYLKNHQNVPIAIVEQINQQIALKIGSPGTFQIRLDIVIGLSLVSFPDKDSQTEFLSQYYLHNLQSP